MPADQRRNKNKQERRAFGLTILHTGHPEVRRLRHEAAQPSLHGQKIWRSSFLLLDYLQQRGINPGARVLEIGCGWGLVGIYCAKIFNAQVTGLDADAAVFPYLQLHAQINGVHIQTRQLAFAHVHTQDLAAFDLIVGSDICFWDELVGALCDLVRHGVKAGVKEILVADPGRPPFDELCACCEKECDAEVIDWEMKKPFSASGLILRVVGNTSQQPSSGSHQQDNTHGHNDNTADAILDGKHHRVIRHPAAMRDQPEVADPVTQQWTPEPEHVS